MVKIIYEDEDVMAVDKPPGLVVTEIQGLLAHRLDKDTSGVLLVAKNQEALDRLQAQFKERAVKKEYLALVHGTVLEAGKVEGAVGRNPWKREKFTVLSTGKQAVTEFQPLQRLAFSERKLYAMYDALFTLVACRPRTGRTHQIRVHLKYIGYPIVADDKYVGRKMNRLDRRWCPRIFLHASKIGFSHPATGKWMEIESPLPEDLKEALNKLNG